MRTAAPGSNFVKRRGGVVDFVAEHPEVAGAQAAIFAALELQDGSSVDMWRRYS